MTLLEYIHIKQISIQSIADALDYTRTHMSNVANGKQKPSSKLKKQIYRLTEGLVIL